MFDLAMQRHPTNEVNIFLYSSTIFSNYFFYVERIYVEVVVVAMKKKIFPF